MVVVRFVRCGNARGRSPIFFAKRRKARTLDVLAALQHEEEREIWKKIGTEAFRELRSGDFLVAMYGERGEALLRARAQAQAQAAGLASQAHREHTAEPSSQAHNRTAELSSRAHNRTTQLSSRAHNRTAEHTSQPHNPTARLSSQAHREHTAEASSQSRNRTAELSAQRRNDRAMGQQARASNIPASLLQPHQQSLHAEAVEGSHSQNLAVSSLAGTQRGGMRPQQLNTSAHGHSQPLATAVPSSAAQSQTFSLLDLLLAGDALASLADADDPSGGVLGPAPPQQQPHTSSSPMMNAAPMDPLQGPLRRLAHEQRAHAHLGPQAALSDIELVQQAHAVSVSRAHTSSAGVPHSQGLDSLSRMGLFGDPGEQQQGESMAGTQQQQLGPARVGRAHTTPHYHPSMSVAAHAHTHSARQHAQTLQYSNAHHHSAHPTGTQYSHAPHYPSTHHLNDHTSTMGTQCTECAGPPRTQHAGLPQHQHQQPHLQRRAAAPPQPPMSFPASSATHSQAEMMLMHRQQIAATRNNVPQYNHTQQQQQQILHHQQQYSMAAQRAGGPAQGQHWTHAAPTPGSHATSYNATHAVDTLQQQRAAARLAHLASHNNAPAVQHQHPSALSQHAPHQITGAAAAGMMMRSHHHQNAHIGAYPPSYPVTSATDGPDPNYPYPYSHEDYSEDEGEGEGEN